MHKPKNFNIGTVKNPVQMDWFTFLNDDTGKLAVPIGPRFQANVPDWTEPTPKNFPSTSDNERDLRWLGSQIWPIKSRNLLAKKEWVGKGRVDFCLCSSPGSIECVKRHIANKRVQLQADLGPAFWKMKFDSMGEEVSKLWKLEEEELIRSILKMNPTSEGKTFVDSALSCMPARSKKDIASYYFNVHLLRRISRQTRSGCINIDTDDEDEWKPPPKGPRKRLQANSVDSCNAKSVKMKYLLVRR